MHYPTTKNIVVWVVKKETTTRAFLRVHLKNVLNKLV